MLKVLLLCLVGFTATVFAATDKIVCYYGNWAVYRNGKGKFDVENIDPHLCTHIIYSFVGLNSDGTVKILDSWTGVDLNGFTRFNNLRTKNAKLKTLIAIGGWNEGSTTYSKMVSSVASRATFISSALNFLDKYGFNGFDLDWEYPAQRGGASTDKANFALLLKEMRPAFDKKGLLLTAAVAAAASSVDLSYDVPALSKYLDFINVMTYDLHGSWESVTGQNAPLYASSVDVTASQKLLNVDACITGWISRGASPSKLVLGVGTYGRSFTLSSGTNAKLGAPTIGAGTAGPITGSSGFLGYNEICENARNGWTVVWDDEQKAPYAHKGTQWVGYDNIRSISLKANYAKLKGLGGLMVWSVETDDFTGSCGTKNPILTQMKACLSSGGCEAAEIITVPTPSPTTSTAPAGPTSSPGTGGSTETVCTKPGYIRDATNCGIFYYCQSNGSGYTMSQFTCASGLYYDENLGVCNWAAQVAC